MQTKFKISLSQFYWLFFSINTIIGIQAQAQEKPEIVLQKGHHSKISSVIFSPDAKYILSVSSDNTIILWDAFTCKEIKTFAGYTGGISKIAFSSDGKYVNTWGWDLNETICIRSLKVWEISTGKEFKRYSDFKDKNVEAISNDLKTIVIKDNLNNSMCFADVETGKTLNEYKIYPFAIFFSPNDKIYAQNIQNYYKPDENLEFWEVGTNKLILSTSLEKGAEIADISPDNTKYIVLDNNKITIYDLKTGKAIKTFNHDKKFYIKFIRFTPDGNGIIYARDLFDNAFEVILSDINLDKENQIFKGIKGNVNSIAWSPDRKSIVVGADNLLKFDVATGKVEKVLKGYTSKILASEVSPDGRYVLLASELKAYLFEINSARLVKVFDQNREIRDFAFLPDMKSFIAGPSKPIQWDIETGEVLRSSNVDANCMAMSPDGKTLFTAYRITGQWGQFNVIIEKLSLTSSETFEVISSLSTIDNINRISMSNDGKYISLHCTSSDYQNYVGIRETSSLAPIFKDATEKAADIAFSPDGKQFATLSFAPNSLRTQPQIKIFNTATGALLRSTEALPKYLRGIRYDYTGKILITIKNDYSVALWNSETFAEILLQKSNASSIILTGNNRLNMEVIENSAKLWDKETGKVVYEIVLGSGQDNQWLVFNSEGYWDGSPNCGDLVTMVKDLENWGIDQFALKNNRPDKILANIPNANPDLINHYTAQYFKRLRKQGFVDKAGKPNEMLVTSDYHVPITRINDLKTNDKFVDLSFKVSDTKFNLKSYNIFVNDVPIYGSSGRKAQGKIFESVEQIELTPGDNKIEVSCINETGAESYRAITVANYKPTNTVKQDLYYVGFGVSKYKDTTLNLNYADKDARDLGDLFNKYKDKFSKVICQVYTNEECTVENIKRAKEVLKGAKPDDIIILFIAGHGMHDKDKDATYYFLTHNTDMKNLKNTAADFETLEDLLQGIPPRNKLFLMDACESGEIDEETNKNFMDLKETDSNVLSRGFKATATTTGKAEQKTQKRSYLFQKDRYIYNDLSRRSGAIVFSSSRGGELSYESSALKNGFFTNQIIKAFQGGAKYEKGMVTVDAMKEFVMEQVSLLSKGKQNPTVDRDNIFQKFSLPVIISSDESVKFLNMVYVKGGKFMNKVSQYYGTAEKMKSFYMGMFEVTQKEWKEIMPVNPSNFIGDSLPVDNVNWYECVEYCNLRSQKEGLQPYYNIDKKNIDKSLNKKYDKLRWSITINESANGYRLPTVMEWTYAASGGQLSQDFKFSGSNIEKEVAARTGKSYDVTSIVGKKKPNELGIFDMTGNVYEWCWDWNGRIYAYPSTSYKYREIKGEDINNYADEYTYLNSHKGFRLVRNAK